MKRISILVLKYVSEFVAKVKQKRLIIQFVLQPQKSSVSLRQGLRKSSSCKSKKVIAHNTIQFRTRQVYNGRQIYLSNINNNFGQKIRDCIIGQLVFDNVTRPGVISNMTVIGYENVHYMDGTYAIAVADNKIDDGR